MPEQVLKARPCAVCGEVRPELLFRQEFAGLSAGSLLKGYDVVLCRRCGLARADNLPQDGEFDCYYAEMSRYEYQEVGGRESIYERRHFEDEADLVEKVAPDRNASVFDIGCSTGGMLAVLKERGYRRLLGLDPSPACAAGARKLYGVEVVTKTISEIDSIQERFDVILMNGVLEHLVSSGAMLGKIRDRLTDRGLFYVGVPDVTAFVEHIDAPFQQFSPEHILYFSPVSLANLLGVSGFATVLETRKACAQSANAVMPVVESVFRRAEAPRDWTADASTGPAIRAYIRACSDMEKGLASRMAELAESRRPVIVWGVGSHAQRLMSTTRLAEANIVAFVDSNPHYHGKSLRGVTVLSPEQLRGRTEPILIASAVYQDDIVEQIRGKLGMTNELICLSRRAHVD